MHKLARDDGRLIDLAAIDVLRSRERGVPRYNEFRRLMHMAPVRSFDELGDDPETVAQLREIYDDDLEDVDLMVGMLGEQLPRGFGFSDTAFRIFVLMASRRLKSDRFFGLDFNAKVYTPEGMAWIDGNDMSSVLVRHYPELAPAVRGVRNAFAPWSLPGLTVARRSGVGCRRSRPTLGRGGISPVPRRRPADRRARAAAHGRAADGRARDGPAALARCSSTRPPPSLPARTSSCGAGSGRRTTRPSCSEALDEQTILDYRMTLRVAEDLALYRAEMARLAGLRAGRPRAGSGPTGSGSTTTRRAGRTSSRCCAPTGR